MISNLRQWYNNNYSEEKYKSFLNCVNTASHYPSDFKISETPVFLSDDFTIKLLKASGRIIDQIVSEDYNKLSLQSVPPACKVPGNIGKPAFIQLDFAVSKDQNNDYAPLLVELQGFPSLYCFQSLLARCYRNSFNIPSDYTNYFNGLGDDAYFIILKDLIIGNHNPENVILLEIQPEHQRTRIDFSLTEKYLGIKSVCITKILKRGKKLYYHNGNKEVLVERIYNRIVFDELQNKGIKTDYNFIEEIETEWVEHPDWFFRISKYALPFLNGVFIPESYFLHDLEKYPEDLNNFVLKPLYSFSGHGVNLEVTEDILNNIKDKNNYILQRKIDYVPFIITPDGNAKAEIRVMYIWPDNSPKPVAVNNLLRLSKGKMLGVAYNKNHTWVGSSVAFHKNMI